MINKQLEISDQEYNKVIEANAFQTDIEKMIEVVLSLGYVTDIDKQNEMYQDFSKRMTKIYSDSEKMGLNQAFHILLEDLQYNVDDIFSYKQAELHQTEILNEQKIKRSSNKEEITDIETKVKKDIKIRDWKLEELGAALQAIDTSKGVEALREEVYQLIDAYALSVYELEKLWLSNENTSALEHLNLFGISLTTREILRNTQESLGLNKDIQKQLKQIYEELNQNPEFVKNSRNLIFLEGLRIFSAELQELSDLLQRSRELKVENSFLDQDIEYKEYDIESTKNISLDIINEDITEQIDSLNGYVKALFDDQERILKSSLDMIHNASENGEELLLENNRQIDFIIIFSILLSISVAFYIILNMRHQVIFIVKKARLIRKLDFTLDIPFNPNGRNKNEFNRIRKELSTIVGTLRETMNDVKVAFENVGSSSEIIKNISDRSADITSNLHHQIGKTGENIKFTSNSIEEISSFVEEIAATSKTIVDLAKSIKQDSSETSASAGEGKKEMEEISQLLMKTHEDVTTNDRVVSEAVQALDRQSHNIVGILESIEGIAKQTNLLALNAAVEAARAGEAGKGFAVVADEIRKLAVETNIATGSIEKLLSQIQNGIASINNTSKTTTNLVLNMTEKSDEALLNFVSISDKLHSVTAAIAELSHSSEEQNRAIEEIAVEVNKSAQLMVAAADEVELIDHLVMTQKEAVQNTNRSAYDMHKLSDDLKIELDKFKT
jgi:methyl-accepting chemotaxis protein